MNSKRDTEKIHFNFVTLKHSTNEKYVENGHSSNEGFTLIPSCNIHFAKVKSIKMTQL